MRTIGKVLAVLWFGLFTLFCIWTSFCLLLASIDGLHAASIGRSEGAEDMEFPRQAVEVRMLLKVKPYDCKTKNGTIHGPKIWTTGSRYGGRAIRYRPIV